MSIHWPIIRACLRAPRDVAIIDEQRSFRRLELLAASLMLADDVEERTTAPHVGVMLPATGVFALTAMALWTLGRVPVPLNFLLKPDELEYIIRDSEIDTIITARPMLEYLGYTPRGAAMRFLEDVDFRHVPAPRWPRCTPGEHLGVLLYTSGTSGRPKGVMLSHDNVTANVRQCIEHLGLRSGRGLTFLGALPQFHSFGLTVLTVMPLTLGARVVYAPRFVPQKIVRLFREHRPDVFIGIPAMYNALLQVHDASPDDFASLRIAVSGGEPLPDAVADAFRQRFGVTIAEGYGLTETSPVTNWCRPDEFRPHSVGRPLPGIEQRIVDPETGRTLPPGRDGEVRIKGPNLMMGYFKQPRATAEMFDEQGFLRTGDIGRFDRDGHLSITGRLKEMLIIAGENVFPREIEEVLARHPAVKAAGVIGRRDPVRGEIPIAFVELREGAAFDERDLRTFLRERLANFKIPHQIHPVEALPRNPTGKLLRRELHVLLDRPAQVRH